MVRLTSSNQPLVNAAATMVQDNENNSCHRERRRNEFGARASGAHVIAKTESCSGNQQGFRIFGDPNHLPRVTHSCSWTMLNTPQDQDSTELGDEVDGLLIVPAFDNEVDSVEPDLSLPDSVPSEVETLGSSPRRRHRWTNTILTVLLGLSLSTNILLGYQQYRQLALTRRLQEQLLAQQQETPKFSWDQEPGSKTCHDSSPLIDNCWLQASAKVRLGECAAETRHKLSSQLSSWGQSLWKKQQVWREKVVESMKPDENQWQEVHVKGAKEVAAVVLSGAAFAALSALVVTESVGSLIDQALNVMDEAMGTSTTDKN